MAKEGQNGERKRNRWTRGMFTSALSFNLLPLLGARPPQISMPSQQPSQPYPSQGRREPPGPIDDRSPLSTRNLEHMREQERRKRLLSDSAKLVELTNQLKQEVDAASKDELSLDVVRKAAEIEKLAHDVKERMKS